MENIVKMNITCIECPKGCLLTVEKAGSVVNVQGYDCLRGKKFGKKELVNPTRTIASTVRTIYPELPVVSVRTDGEIPKDAIMKVMEEINKLKVENIYPVGEVLIKGVAGTEADIIITTDMKKVIGQEIHV